MGKNETQDYSLSFDVSTKPLLLVIKSSLKGQDWQEVCYRKIFYQGCLAVLDITTMYFHAHEHSWLFDVNICIFPLKIETSIMCLKLLFYLSSIYVWLTSNKSSIFRAFANRCLVLSYFNYTWVHKMHVFIYHSYFNTDIKFLKLTSQNIINQDECFG